MEARPLDVLIIGGGISGVGCALDAAARGLRVGLVEKHDYAHGTSGWSSKMIHGGLRYLAQGNIGLVREALHERASLQDRARHLVRAMPVVLPIYGWRASRARLTVDAGLWMYDLLGAWRAGVRHRWMDRDEVLAATPNLNPTGLKGALSYQDAQADDVALVLSVLRTAVAHGALVANYAGVTDLLRHGDRVIGATVTTTEGDELTMRARCVLNATGIWSDQIASLGSGGPAPSWQMLPSRGIHLTLPRDIAGVNQTLFYYSMTGTNVFIEPWSNDLAIAGTTDTIHDGDLDSPQATSDDVDEVLGALNASLRRSIAPSDVLSSWAGLRPLVHPAGADPDPRSTSRNHDIVGEPGLVSLVGGKLTTYRAMAEQAVDRVCAQIGTRIDSSTHDIALDGCMEKPRTSHVDAVVREWGTSRATARHLLRRHGANVPDLLAPARTDPSLLELLHEDRPYLAAEARWAAQHEMALGPDDVLWRRTRIGLETADPSSAHARASQAAGFIGQNAAPHTR